MVALDYWVRAADFRGPLEELTEAARSNDVPLSEVPVAGLVMDFARHLDSRGDELPLGVASEYLMMFSELIRLKIRLMLPGDDTGESVEDLEGPGEEERGFFQRVARRLRVQARQRARLYDTEPDVPQSVQDGVTNYQEVTLFELLQAFGNLLETQVEKPLPDLELTNEYSTEERIEWMKQEVPEGHRRAFLELMSERPTREEIIVTFLAILHLVKSRRLRLIRPEEGGTIQVLGLDSDDSDE